MKVRIPRDDFFCATMKRNRNVHQTEAFYDYLGKKYPKPSSTNREKLFRMLILSTYFKVIEIDEIVHFVNNYRVLRLSNLNSHIDILMLIGR